MAIERRPDSRNYSAATFPEEWGTAPSDTEAREKWVLANIRNGIERRAKGESVPWLGKIEARA